MTLHTDLKPNLKTLTLTLKRPHFYPYPVPDLAGPVAVLDKQHRVLSVVNVSVLLAAEQHKHPIQNPNLNSDPPH